MSKGKFGSSAGKYSRDGRAKSRRKRKHSLLPVVLLVLCVLTFLIVWFWNPFAGEETPEPSAGTPTEETASAATESSAATGPEPTETQLPEIPAETVPPVSAAATVSVTGDVLMHMPVVNSGYSSSDGSYDFTEIFQYLGSYAAEADCAIANLETTLAGNDNGYAYSGHPCFNCPDAIAEALKSAGFDMLLTANNHCYDTRSVGLGRTQEVASELGLDTLGTQPDAEAADYVIKELNGISIGMMCYTYASVSSSGSVSINTIPVSSGDRERINHFDYNRLDDFYADVEEAMTAMERDGVQATVLYIHWGTEYQLSPNENQTAIAQKLCDLGVDVIVGGHPHVVQPLELLTSTVDENHKTVCLYSMGNAISNQRRQNMRLTTGHTEDGVLFSFTFTKYSDGEVLLDSVEILPTWVWRDTSTGTREYRILPLDPEAADWAAAFGISESDVSSAQSSYDRTMELVGEGLADADEYLTARREAKLAALTQSDF